MITLDIMANQPVYDVGSQGQLKAINGANGSPIPSAPGFPDLQKQFNELEITDIRLHDTYGPLDIDNYYPTGRTVSQLMANVPENQRDAAGQLMSELGNKRSIFPNAALGMKQGDLNLALKDANFAISDSYLRTLINNEKDNPKSLQRKVIFRIGRSMDGGFMMPENIEIFTALVANVVDRYTNNYASIGLKRKVTHWEIWNEPNLGYFWNESPKNYFHFYGEVATAIKKVDPEAKVGGPGIVIFTSLKNAYVEDFLAYCRENNTPLDFFAWHLYSLPNPENFIGIGDYIRNRLTTYGFGHIESVLGEWNSSPVGSVNTFSKVQGVMNAAYIASAFIQMQFTTIDKAYYYRADGSSFGLFNRAKKNNNSTALAYCSYAAQTFKLFAMMLETPNIIRCSRINGTGLSIMPARSDKKINILVANYKINSDLHNSAIAPSSGFYEQYCVNADRSFSQLNDMESREKYFGGKDPATLYCNNQVDEVAAETSFESHISPNYKYYSDSEGGVTINLYGIQEKIQKMSVYRIYEGGDLSKLQPEEIDSDSLLSQSKDALTITDPGAVEYTVTLYSLLLV